jgi:putative ABC transport system substrate-binding protein
VIYFTFAARADVVAFAGIQGRAAVGSKVRRREFIAGLAGAAALPLTVRAQQPAGIYRIGVLETLPPDSNKANFAALLRGLHKYGYIEGQNLHIEYRSADGHDDRFPALVADLIGRGVDLIVTRGTPAAKSAKAATTTIPVVMAAIGEPLGVGVVASLAQPGGNVTGFSAFVTELSGKRVELLKETFPSIARVGFLLNLGNPVSPPQWEATLSVAKTLGLSAEVFDVRGDLDIAAAFAAMRQRGVNALSVGIDAVTQANAATIAKLAAEQKLPTAYPAREFVELGGLLSYGVDYPDLYYRAAGLIDKIFKGARPANLPVEQPTKLELVINLRTANTLGLEFPPTLIARADEVIE